jgi:hypothetical protein
MAHMTAIARQLWHPMPKWKRYFFGGVTFENDQHIIMETIREINLQKIN